MAKRAKWLQNVPLLQGLSARQLSLMAGALTLVTFQPKEAIVTQGERGDKFYILEQVRLFYTMYCEKIEELTCCMSCLQIQGDVSLCMDGKFV